MKKKSSLLVSLVLAVALLALLCPLALCGPAVAADPHIAWGLLRHGKVVDLTTTVAENLPGWWPTHMPFQAKIYNWFTTVPSPYPGYNWMESFRGPYYTRWYALDEHVGTHYDAPVHFTSPGMGPADHVTNEHVPLEQLMGPAIVIDVAELRGTAGPGKSPLITKAFIKAWEAKHPMVKIHEGDIVLFRSGYDDDYYKPFPEGNRLAWDVIVTGKEEGWPAPDPDAVKYLFDKGVRNIGTDGPSMGPAQAGAPTHTAVLPYGMIFTEFLVNLGQLPIEGSFFIFLPLKTAGGSGCPGRAIAFVP